MTPKDKVLKEIQEFHECFYDYSKSNTAEMKRKSIEEYINKTYKVLYEMHEENLIINQKLDKALTELEELKRDVARYFETTNMAEWNELGLKLSKVGETK